VKGLFDNLNKKKEPPKPSTPPDTLKKPAPKPTPADSTKG
jgi:hypothetical protein